MNISRIKQCLPVLGASLMALTLSAGAEEPAGAIYTMDNAAGANHVLAWTRAENGALTWADAHATGGAGNGSGLSSQGSVILSRDGRWLFVCNAGSDDVSVFAVSPNGLRLVDRASSGGRLPLSLALHHNLLYVLNAGGTVGDKDSISALLFADGKLTSLPHSTRELSGDNTGSAQVSFVRNGEVLVVTERTTSLIDTFTLNEDGLADAHKVFPSAGATPFGFAVGRQGRIFVSEAQGAAANASSASSYSVSAAGELTVLSAAVPTEQTSACWLVTTGDGHLAYTANAASGSISGYSVAPNGTLHLLDPSGVTAVTGAGSHPVDMITSIDGEFLFAVANGNGTLAAFGVNPNGSLTPLPGVSGIPTSAAGLAGR